MDAFDAQHADERATLLALHALGSFAAAGRALQRHPSVLSRRLSALEARLGVRLVERSTRQLRFTDAGLRLVERLQQARQLLEEAEQEARQTAQELRGRLRLALPAAMGRRLLSPMIAAFALAHPEVVLEVEYGERFVDLVGERFDAALRIGELADSRLVASSCTTTRAGSVPRRPTWPATARRPSRRTCGSTTAWASPAWPASRSGGWSRPGRAHRCRWCRCAAA
jgi:DNA-binding transcriptional LysR family regulator